MIQPNKRQGKSALVPRLALRPSEAAEAIGISERLVYDMLKRGELPYLKIGTRTVIPVDELRKCLAEKSKQQTRSDADNGECQNIF